MEKFGIPFSRIDRGCSDNILNFKDTSSVEPLDGIIGQQRAVEAIDFGLHMKGPEYNIFVTGMDGTGRASIVRKLLGDHAAKEDLSRDLCMVNNFEDEYCPLVFEMPPGSAVHFSNSMIQFLQTLKTKIPGYFETAQFKEAQEEVVEKYSAEQKAIFDEVHQEAARHEMEIHRTENGYAILPLDNDGTNGEAGQEEITGQMSENNDVVIKNLEDRLSKALKSIHLTAQKMKEELKGLVAARTQALISEQIDPLRYYFRECDGVRDYLTRVKDDIIEHLAMFINRQMAPEQEKGEDELTQMAGLVAKRYMINVLVDRRHEKGAPVVFEPNPTFGNLFGKIEKKAVMGSITTDFTMVQAGSLLKANNGYLVINIDALLKNPSVWEALKQTLQTSRLQIEDMPDQADYGMPSLKPAPIPIRVKVVLIGGYHPFLTLQAVDAKFNKIFKVRADFDYETKRDADSVYNFARYISLVCRTEKLLDMTSEGVCQIVDFGSRLADDNKKLSLQFGRIRALLMEADFWARRNNAETIDKEHVQDALKQYRRRHNLYEDKVMEQFDDDSVLLSVTGNVVGQLNALAVYDMGEIAFGRPTRITAESYMGTPGIINVERESELSGQTHDKGMLIISGYLGRIFAQAYPLSVSISITFEQSYDGVDGDSASSTELYAVLSSLSEIPIRQEIAVTGSVNQKGEIQAIGGVNEKIEGFFEICLRKGLTGNQGVMIPASNVKNLVLRDSVLNAVRQKKFHLYSVATIEEGIEVLTGVPAGKQRPDNTYPEGTVFGAVQEKLARYHQLSQKVNR